MNLVDTDPSKKTVPNKNAKAPAPTPDKAPGTTPPKAPAPKPGTAASNAAPAAKPAAQPLPSPATAKPAASEVQAVVFEPSPIPSIPPTKYTLLDRVTPGGRRRRQLANMENGFRQILGLVQSMRENQQVLFKAFEKLPEAVDSVKKLADHSAQQAELLQAMNTQMTGGTGAPLGKFNETLASMDKTTQLLLERAQRSEERLYGMLRRAQRRITVMTLLVVLTFAGGLLYVLYPEQARSWIDSLRPSNKPALESPAPESTTGQPPAAVSDLFVPPAPPESFASAEVGTIPPGTVVTIPPDEPVAAPDAVIPVPVPAPLPQEPVPVPVPAADAVPETEPVPAPVPEAVAAPETESAPPEVPPVAE